VNIALVIAGGVGKRTQQEIPKQFLHVEDKPLIIYTLEAFQRHPEIHEIAVVCLEGWHEILRAYAKQFNISKLRVVVNGGAVGQESIKNGLVALKEDHVESDIVLIHDAVRPMVSQEIISDALVKCVQYGSAVSFVPCVEVMLLTDDRLTSGASIDRDWLIRTQTPQTFPLGKLLWAHEEAAKRGITNSIASCSLMTELGETVHFSLGSEKNIKLTTLDDMDIFKAMLNLKNK
jgi:2-C-methyl-D-erythritol 4-phosphate cytidylyltransferase